ncbi:hypothetical protein [Maioricimonas sp. JC845]|uniref:hypothetical protein n=1 Tax=Maioricimonas sp. JC845 TaxID=3232138 RepID=UPI00345A968B
MNRPEGNSTFPLLLAVLPLLLTGDGLEAALDAPDASATTGWEEQAESSHGRPSRLQSTTTLKLTDVHHAVLRLAGVPRFPFPSRLANFAGFHSVTDATVV